MNREPAIAAQPPKPGEGAQTNAFVMICDVSEFVKIASTHRLFFGPKIGAEKTRIWLDQVFDLILSCIGRHQGQTIQFIGDAVVARFPEHSANHVISCAQEIRLGCSRIQAGQLAKQFTQVKSGIALGLFSSYSPAQLENVPLSIAGGPAVEQALRALQLAGPHDIVCDDTTLEALHRLTTDETSTQLRQGFHLISLRAQTHAVTLPEPEQPGMTGRQERNEIKLLTILYIEFLAEKPAHMQANWLSDLFVKLNTLNQTHNATLIGACQTLKGLRVQLAVGHLKSELNDVELAVQLATQIQSRSTRSVIGYGHAWQGRYGGKHLKLFNAHGGEVNLAARILEKSEQGHIYLTEQASQQFNDTIPLIELAEVAIKGEADPVRIFRIPLPHEVNPQRELQPNALHGRSHELEQVLGLLGYARTSGESCVIEITGEAGVGKSTFVRSVQSQLKQQGQSTIELRSNPYSRLLPYSIAFPFIVELSKLYRASSPEAWLSDSFAPDPTISVWLGLIGLITPLKIQASDLVQQAPPEVKTRAIAHIFSAIADKVNRDLKLVFVVEDLQWYDNASVQLLLDEVMNRQGCQSVYTIRTSGEDARTTELLSRLNQIKARKHNLPLFKFQTGETALFLAKWFDVESVPSPLTEALQRLSEGNLLLLSTLIQRLLQENIVRKFNHLKLDIDFRRLEQFSAIPINLEHALQTRIDQVTAHHRQVLAHCSIFKTAFTANELCDAFSYPDLTELEQTLEILVQHKLLKPATFMPGQRQFRFEHQVIEQCVYDRIPFEERRRQHAQFATWLESQMLQAGEGGKNRLSVRLATQYDLAGLLDKAFPLSQRAADYAFEVGALDEALERLNKLIKWHESGLLPGTSDLEVARWLEKKAQIYFAQGQLFDARNEYKNALSHTGHYKPMPRKVSAFQIKANLGLIYIQDLAPSIFKKRKRPATEESLLALRIYTCLSELEFYTGGGEIGHLYLVRAIEIVNRYTVNTGDLAKAYAGCAILAQIYCKARWTQFFIKKTYQSLNAITDEKERSRADAHINHRLGYMAYSSGRFELALKLYAKSANAARLGHEFQIELLALSAFILVHNAQGRFEDALVSYASYEELAKKYASSYFNIFHQYGLLNQRIYALAMLGRLTEAREALIFLEKIAAELNFNPISTMSVNRCKLMLLYREQDWPAARQHALQMAKTLRVDAEEKAYLCTCISLPLEVLLESDLQYQPLKKEEEEIVQTLLNKLEKAQQRFVLSTPAYLILKAQYLIRQGKPGQAAKKHLHKARHLAVRNGQLVEQKRAEYLLSKLDH